MALKAIQQIMLGTVCKNEKQTLETLHAVKEAGYDGIELNGFMIRPTPMIVRTMTKLAGMPVGKGGNYPWKELTDKACLQVVSIHEDLGTIKRAPASVIEEARKFQTDKIVITGMYRFDYSDETALLNLTEQLNASGEILKKAGIELLYHNHNCEFRKLFSGKTAYEFLIEETDPRYVGFEFDSYWPTEAGVSAIHWMKRLGSRMKLYHINDRGTRISKASATPILKSDSIELGFGNMNLEELTEQALRTDVSAIILESHKNWIEKSPIRSMQVSAAFLNRMIPV